MAIRTIRTDGDEILRKKSRKIEVIDDKIKLLLKDMADTMYEADGVGLAAVQIGVLKRLVVIDVGEGLLELINPVIIDEKGEQTDNEGCLSVPGYFGEVKRPAEVTVTALNTKGEEITINGSQLLAVALCHEIDHLDGVLFKDKATKLYDKNKLNEEEN